MSIEESINKLADSQNRLADAMTHYATVMQNIAEGNPTTMIAPSTAGPSPEVGGADGAPAKKGRRTKAQIEADNAAATTTAGEADPFAEAEADPFADGGEEAAPALTAETIRGLVLRVKEKNVDNAKKLLKALGVATLAAIPEKDYPRVVELAAKVGVTL